VTPLYYHEEDELVFVDKPAGFSTHAPDKDKLGLVEIFSNYLKTPLYVVHRLDKETTGCLVFAKTKSKAQIMLPLFEEHQIEKKYLFLTDQKSTQSEFLVKTPISGQSAITEFQRIKRSPFYELWQAVPKTGRQHQIRKHAAEIGLPILGDGLYGGSPFPHLCLHSLEIKIPGFRTWTCPEPRFFQRLGLLRDQKLIQMMSAVDRRQRLYHFLSFPEQSWRLCHNESLPIKIDLLGPMMWVYWYDENDPSEKNLDRLECLSSILNRPWLLRKIQNRGKDPLAKTEWVSLLDLPTDWLIQEGKLKFQMHRNRGLSPGIFLDQRSNRKFIADFVEQKKDASVLNLFSYTCGFSVAAAKSNAKEVVSVDVSSDFLDWGKQNFKINQLNPDHYEFFKQDVMLFLKGTIKRQRKFDIIICDPPSFARNKDRVFKLEKDLGELLNLCAKCLKPGGILLISCNLEKWSRQEFSEKVLAVPGLKEYPHGPLPDWDYELPNTDRAMKWMYVHLFGDFS
jgi:23S rRNA (cytosine1962-C5)-methyltransferase